jgi:ribosome-binding protein aMBF1 (putative translation factor)
MDTMTNQSPIGNSVSQARGRRARQSVEYRDEQARLAPYEDLARMVIRLRIDYNLTQEALASRVGTSKTAISRLESGQHAPTAESLRKIASAFGGHLVIGVEMPNGSSSGQPIQHLARVS